jgi:hypothetical protein
MSDEKFKLSELRAALEAMTSGPYRYDHQGWIETMDRSVNHTGSETEVLLLGARNSPADGEGVAALVNAAPVLLEVLVAAREYRDACYASGRGAPTRRACAIAALNKALAKVTP